MRKGSVRQRMKLERIGGGMKINMIGKRKGRKAKGKGKGRDGRGSHVSQFSNKSDAIDCTD